MRYFGIDFTSEEEVPNPLIPGATMRLDFVATIGNRPLLIEVKYQGTGGSMCDKWWYNLMKFNNQGAPAMLIIHDPRRKATSTIKALQRHAAPQVNVIELKDLENYLNIVLGARL